jgi:hypothetical protein
VVGTDVKHGLDFENIASSSIGADIYKDLALGSKWVLDGRENADGGLGGILLTCTVS